MKKRSRVACVFPAPFAPAAPARDAAPLTAPAARRPPAACSVGGAFDAGRGGLVLFGGSAGRAGVLGETWEWDGKGWRAAE